MGDYAGVDLIYNITDGQVTESPVLVNLPRIDDKETVLVKQNWPEDQFFTFDSIPNLEVTVYAGTILILVDGSQPDPFPLIAIDVPVDRLPEEMPPDDTEVMPFIVAFQPANAEASQPVAVSFPNILNTVPGTSQILTTLDPTQGVMVPYGTGVVSADGTKIVPDLDPAFPDTNRRYGLVHFDWHGSPSDPNNPENQPNPDNQCNACPCPQTESPVDFVSGIETLLETDITINGLRGLVSIQRNYRTLSTQAGPFGIGTNHNYGYRLDTNTPQNNVVINLIMPDGNRIPFNHTVDGFRNSTLPITIGTRIDVAANGESTLRWKNGTVFHFISSTVQLGSVLESITDTNGNRISLHRNPLDAAEITEIIDPVGRKLRLTYDAANRITSIIDPIGRQVKYTYNATGTLETVTDPENGLTRYDYNAQNRLNKITDARGVVVAQNTYNQNGRVIEQIQADGGVIKIDYTLANPTLGALSPILKTVVTDPLGNITIYRFSPQGILLDVTDALGQTRIYEREPGTNQLLAIKGTASCLVCGNTAAGDQFFNYDTNGNLLMQTDTLGHTTSYIYEPVFNKVKTITDPLGHVTSFGYDAAGNLLSSTDQNNNITSFQYNEFGLLTKITDPLNASTTFAYDSFGNQISTTDALGNTNLSRYDAISRLIESVDALGAVSTSEYDKLNRIIASTDARGNTTTMDFDAIGNLLSLTDARNNTTAFTYDGLSRTKTRTDSNGKPK